MGRNGLSMVSLDDQLNDLNDILSAEKNTAAQVLEINKKVEDELNAYRKRSAEELTSYKEDLLTRSKKRELDLELDINKKLAKSGISAQERKDFQQLSKDKLKRLTKEEKDEYNRKKKQIDLINKYEKEKRKELAKEEAKENAKEIFGNKLGWNKNASLIQNFKNMHDVSEISGKAGFLNVVNALSDLAKQLDQSIDKIASKKGNIDTRLQGSSNKKRLGSYWDAISSDITGVAGVSPLVKQEKVIENVENLVGKGISFDIEQRAFLQSISDKIATTFDATDATLVKLVRIQQADTTAARLGMESALTAFLNNMYETTEYMTDAASDIRAQLYEATALMGVQGAAEFEYQVQKWLGSLYSVGMSQNAVSGIASTLGKIASGDISGITNGGNGNLLIMAANAAGLSVADALQQGLDEGKTNQLMVAMVDYLAKMYDESKDSRVVQQQLANVFGVTAADLKAAKNLSRSNRNVFNNNLNYGGMNSQLMKMANSMYSRTSLGEMLGNAWSNLQYSTAAGIANDPILYATYKTAGLLDAVAGGIAIPAFSVMGNMVDLETTVADIMRVGALSGGILSGLGKMIMSIGAGGGFIPSGMLKSLGINGSTNIVTRGTGIGLISTGPTTSYSESGIIGNADSSAVKDKSMQEAQESGNQQLAEAQDDSSETKLSTVDEHVVAIYNLLQDVVGGTSSLHVDMGNISAWEMVMKGQSI